MPKLNNERHELYSRHRAKGMNAIKAAIAAGFAVNTSTTHLEHDPEIVVRIQELTDEMNSQREAHRIAAMEAAKIVGQMTGITRAWVIEKLAANAQVAAQAEDFKESNAALKLIGEEFGMFKGGQGEDPADAGVRTLDLDAVEGVLDSAERGLPQVADVPADESRVFPPDFAQTLIEGNATAARRLARDRAHPTGSETDVALEDHDPLGGFEEGEFEDIFEPGKTQSESDLADTDDESEED